jgi:hypothetical protein
MTVSGSIVYFDWFSRRILEAAEVGAVHTSFLEVLTR